MDKYKLVADFHGPAYLVKLLTGELKAKDNQKMFFVVDGIADYHAFQNLLSRAHKFLEEPDKLRFFFTTSGTFDFHVFIVEKVDG